MAVLTRVAQVKGACQNAVIEAMKPLPTVARTAILCHNNKLTIACLEFRQVLARLFSMPGEVFVDNRHVFRHHIAVLRAYRYSLHSQNLTKIEDNNYTP